MASGFLARVRADPGVVKFFFEGGVSGNIMSGDKDVAV